MPHVGILLLGDSVDRYMLEDFANMCQVSVDKLSYLPQLVESKDVRNQMVWTKVNNATVPTFKGGSIDLASVYILGIHPIGPYYEGGLTMEKCPAPSCHKNLSRVGLHISCMMLIYRRPCYGCVLPRNKNMLCIASTCRFFVFKLC